MFARTKRLTLRPGWPEDAPALAQAIGHESVVAKLARAPWPYALGDAEAFLAQPRAGHDPHFLIETMEAGVPRLVGGSAFVPRMPGINLAIGWRRTPGVADMRPRPARRWWRWRDTR
ncbi:hypothetical protein HMP09_3204 [Sphingomonas sp. HMP9]|nr:hypothetical protein HMP09_3204 [Sphingomonas sp. HMP9]